jgi:hypothetical protein
LIYSGLNNSSQSLLDYNLDPQKEKKMKRASLTGLALFLGALLICLPSTVHPAARYVSGTTGSDATGDGSQGDPWATIQYAVNQASSGDTVCVAAGIYYEQVSIFEKTMYLLGGYEPASWTRNVPVYQTVIDGGGGTSVIDNSCGLYSCPPPVQSIIDGIIIQNGTYGIYNRGGTMTANNNIIRNNSDTGVLSIADAHAAFDTGFWGYPNARMTLSNNLITQNYKGVEALVRSSGQYHMYCLYAYGYLYSTNDTIEGNVSSGIAWKGYMESRSPMYYCYPYGNAVIRNSIVYGNGGDASLQQIGAVEYSDIGEGYPGLGNLSIDPMFWDPAYPDHGLMPGSSCIDAGDPDPSYNDPDGSRNDMGFTGGTSVWFDTDYDGIPDSWEIHYGFDPYDPADAGWDCDGDSVTNRYEYFQRTDPGNCVDTDGDGLFDIEEAIIGTDPNNWDTDGDYIPDLYEVQNTGQSPPLDPFDPSDGDTCFEPAGFKDANPNYHEYWNDTDPWSNDPAPPDLRNPACFYWGEADGDGIVQGGDKLILGNAIIGLFVDYRVVIPDNGDSQDLDADGVLAANDMTILKSFIINAPVGLVLSRPVSLEKVYEPVAAVEVGTTTHVTVKVRADDTAINLYQSSFAVVFEIDPSSIGEAILLGGEGDELTGRYDVSGPSAPVDGGFATIHLKVTAPGAIQINATIPACGVSGIGRWLDEVVLSPAFSITAVDP